MSEEEDISKSEGIIAKKSEDIGIEEEESSDKETKISSEETEGQLEVKACNIRFKPKINLDPKNQRFPFCLVWTPLPCVTWFLPSIGHVGIGTSEGIIRDYAGDFHVAENHMAFGNPTKYLILELDGREIDQYDQAIKDGIKAIF